MITLRPVGESDWPAVAGRFADLTFEQTLAYARPAAARIGARCRFVALERDGALVAAAAVRVRTLPVIGRGIAWIPSGPLTCLDDGPTDSDVLAGVLSALNAQFVRREGHALRFRLPGVAGHDPAAVTAIAAQAGFVPTTRAPAYRSFAMDLRQDPDAMMRGLHGKWRTDLRFAQKSGLTVERGTGPEMIARFMTMFDAVQSAKGFNPDIPPGFHFALAGGATDYALDVLIVSRDGADLAGIVIGTCGRTATYLFGATVDAGRPVRAGYLLQWEAIGLSRARGLHWYDLGGIDFDSNPDVSRFKERMGGTLVAADPFESRPADIIGRVIGGLEAARARMKARSR